MLINPAKIRLVTHYARLNDPSASPDIALVAEPMPQPSAWLVTPPDQMCVVGTDKENYHANVLAHGLRMAGACDLVGGDALRKLAAGAAEVLVPACARWLLANPALGGRLGVDAQVLGDILAQSLPAKERSKQYKEFAARLTEIVVALFEDGGQASSVDDEIKAMVCAAMGEVAQQAGLAGGSLSAATIKAVALARMLERPQEVIAEALRMRQDLARRDRVQEAPLRQMLKQIVLPGPQGDVVVTPLPSLVLLRHIVGLADVAVGYRSRFIRKQRRLENLQNIGISDTFMSLRYVFPSPQEWRASEAGTHMLAMHAKNLYDAIAARRAYLLSNGMSVRAPRSRSDLDANLVEVSRRAAADVVDDATDDVADMVRKIEWVVRRWYEQHVAPNKNNRKASKTRWLLNVYERLLIEQGVCRAAPGLEKEGS